MPYDSISEAKKDKFPTMLNGVELTLEQINHLADIYDAIKENKDIDTPMAVAIAQFKKLYEKKDDKWVKKEKLSVDGGELDGSDTSWVEIIREGKWKDINLSITKDILLKIKENFDNKVLSVDIAVDVEHKPENGAYGWVKELEVVKVSDVGDFLRSKEYNEEKINKILSGDFFSDESNKGKYVLFGKIEWNNLGKELLEEDVYKYMSAEIDVEYVDSETGKKYDWVLTGVALTNRPVVKGQSGILLSEKEVKRMELESKIEQLEKKLSEIAEKVEKIEKMQEIKPPDEAQEESMPFLSITEMADEEIEKMTLVEVVGIIEKEIADEEKWGKMLEADRIAKATKMLDILNAKIKTAEEITNEIANRIQVIKEKLDKLATITAQKLSEILRESIEEKKKLSELLEKEKMATIQLAVEDAISKGVPPKYRQFLSELYIRDRKLFNEFVEKTKGTVDLKQYGSGERSGLTLSETQRKINEILGVKDEVFAKYNPDLIQ